MPEAMVKFAMDTAREAGDILRGYFKNVRPGTAKNDRGDVVTDADLESEALIVSRIREEYPDHRILAEESGLTDVPEGECTWVIDPLDGTKNFTKSIPYFCVSIGVVCGKRPVAGVVYDPIHDEMFYAVEGAGAYLDGRLIKVSSLRDPKLMMVNMAWSHNREGDLDFGRCAVKLVETTNYYRRLGAAALAMSYTAAGRLDATALVGLKPWDVVAAALIIREAGGIVTDLQGKSVDLLSPRLDVLTANPVLHDWMVKEIFTS